MDAGDGVTSTESILHLISAADWATAQQAGTIEPESLTTEGFVHCSTPAQLPGVIDRYYAERTDMLVLRLDPSALADTVRWEAPAHPDGSANTAAEAAHLYPHVYGPIPVDAVDEVRTA